MNGKIYFETVQQLGEFLKAFTGSTATFEVTFNGAGKPTLTFLGGY